MRRQGAATPGAPHRVSVGGAPSLCLPRLPRTAPLRRLPPAPPPCALVSSPEKVITVQCQNSCKLQYDFPLRILDSFAAESVNEAAAESVNARVRAAMQGSLVTACPGTFRVGSRQYIMKDGYRRLTTYGLFSPARCCCSVVWAWRLPCFVILRHFW